AVRGRVRSTPARGGQRGRAGNRRNACFALPAGTLAEVDWVTEESRRRVRTAAVVARRPCDGKVQVYAFGGWGPDEAARLRRRAGPSPLASRPRSRHASNVRAHERGTGARPPAARA